jgi:hypothetical protein
MTVGADSYVVPPADMMTLQKIWDIGMEEIVVQTVVHMTGDVTTRVQDGIAGTRAELVLSIHRQTIDVSVGRWRDLLQAIKEIAGTAVGVLLGRAR